MKRIITILLLVVFCAALSAEGNEKEKGLTLELNSNTRSLRIGQGAGIQLKIVGQAITEIVKDTNDIKSIVFNKKPAFVYQFSYQPTKKGNYILGPYSLSFNGVNLISNSLIIKVLPEWVGGLGTIFRTDCNEINLGESFELVMETWSKERKNFDISALFNPELAVIESAISRSQTNIKNLEESHYFSKSWFITPKSRGEFLITKELFKEFPDDIEPPQLKVQVK